MCPHEQITQYVCDACFSAIAKFSDLEMRAMLKIYPVATVLMGLVILGIVYLISIVL